MEFEIIKNDAAKVCIDKVTALDVDYYTLKITYDVPTVPEKIKILFRTPLTDAVNTWTPMTEKCCIRPEWSPTECVSALARSMPLLGFVSENEHNRGFIALSDVKNKISFSVGVVEETCEALWTIQLFENACEPITSYEITLRVDNRDVKFSDAVKGIAAWWESLGNTPAFVPTAALHTTYSTWYNFHQKITKDGILEELKTAKELGFKTVIVDDGWQCTDNSRGYAYTGDWEPKREKIGDVREFCAECHDLGIKVMFWYSVPYVGRFSNNFERFKDKCLYMCGNGNWMVVDPRYRAVRDFLVNLYKEALIKYDLDGLKLDFIDCFTLKPESPAYNDKMDIPVLEDAVYKLMCDVYGAMRAVKQDVMIEFRQSYVGPMIRSFGNMLRVFDCPYGAETNLRSIAELRLHGGNTAIHSDMLMWHSNTPYGDVARQLLATLFAVPQISVMLNKMPEDHLAVLKEFIRYREENLELLMNGDFDCAFPERCGYMKSSCEEKQICALYRGNLFVLENKNTDVFFATAGDNRILDLTAFDCDFVVTVKDCFGKQVETLTARGLAKIFVPVCGRVEIRPL